MASHPKLEAIIRSSALRNARMRLAGRLIQALGLRPTSNDLGIPLGAPDAKNNLAAVCTWVDRNGGVHSLEDFEAARSALLRSVHKWELDRWD